MSAEPVSVCPHRDFRDDDEQPWTAWDVIPAWGERRRGERRGVAGTAPLGIGERRRSDRRRIRGIRIALTPRLANGWLAFESGEARRRFAPIPPDWHLLPEDELRKLWRAAEQLPRKRRRLIE